MIERTSGCQALIDARQKEYELAKRSLDDILIAAETYNDVCSLGINIDLMSRSARKDCDRVRLSVRRLAHDQLICKPYVELSEGVKVFDGSSWCLMNQVKAHAGAGVAASSAGGNTDWCERDDLRDTLRENNYSECFIAMIDKLVTHPNLKPLLNSLGRSNYLDFSPSDVENYVRTGDRVAINNLLSDTSSTSL